MDIIPLLEAVELSVTTSWEHPGEIRKRMQESLMTQGRPFSPERVRAALELLATEEGSLVERKMYKRQVDNGTGILFRRAAP